MIRINVLTTSKFYILIFFSFFIFSTIECYAQKIYLSDLTCYLNATSMRLQNISQSYGSPVRIGNSTVDITVLSSISYKNKALAIGIGWKNIITDIDYSLYTNDTNGSKFYAASKIIMENDYLTFPIAYEIQIFEFNHETAFYCRPSASLNMIISNKRLFYRTFNYKYAEQADAAFEVFNKTKFGSYLHPAIDIGIKAHQNKYVLDLGIRINSSIKNLYGEFAGVKSSLGIFLGLGYKI